MGGYQQPLADRQVANPPPCPAGRLIHASGKVLARLDAHRDEVVRQLDDGRVASVVAEPTSGPVLGRLRRRDLLGGLIHEYELAA